MPINFYRIPSIFEAQLNAALDALQAAINAIDPDAVPLTGAEIKVLYEAEADTNAFTDTEKAKLGDVETAATADQTSAEIEAAYNAEVAVVSQAEAEAGTVATVRRWTAQRVAQAIAAQAAGNFVSVKSFGAVGDGVADDSEALQEARDSLADTGGILFYPAGTYLLSAAQTFVAGVIDQGEFGGTVIKMANGANIVGMFTASGAKPFFGMRDMILWGNRGNQTGQVSRGIKLDHSITSVNYSTNAPQPIGSEILDCYYLFENVLILGIDGQGIDAGNSAYGYASNVHCIGCNGVGISTGVNDGIWQLCTTGGCWHEGWECFAGSGRYYGCKGFFTGTGGASDGSFGNYTRGGAFRIINSNQMFVGCEGQDCDGPAFMVQGDGISLTGCHATQACNLEGISESIGQDPVRGGGYTTSTRVAVLLTNSDDCDINFLARDKLIGGAFTPALNGIVEIKLSAHGNTVVGSAPEGILDTNKRWVVETTLDAYSQHNTIITPFGLYAARRTLGVDDATPLVFGGGLFVTANANATTITDFDLVRAGLAVGERFCLQIADANTTIDHNASLIVTKSGSDITAQGVYEFLDVNGVWYEV